MECLSWLLPYDERASKDDKYLFIFNPSPFERSDIVETNVEFFLQDVVVGLNPEVKVAPKLPPVEGFRLEGPDGKTIPYQIVSREEGFGITYSKHDYPNQTLVDRFSILVSAEKVPAMGWKGFKIIRTGAPVQFHQSVHVGENFLENDFLKVEISSDGALRILDKQTKASYEPMNIFEDSGDVGDEYSYSYPEHDERVESTQFQPVIHVIERRSVRASIQIDQTMVVPASASSDERSRSSEKTELGVSTVISLTPFSKRLDFKTTVRNSVKDHRFRVLFHTGIQSRESYAETPFAVVKRVHQEYDNSRFPYELPAFVSPMQRFVTILDGQKGCTLITRGLPEYELSVREPGVLALTLLRCVGKLSGR
ncbi:MAG: hypothetical protein HYY49_11365, partial [Ignavibacteriales bacterium]|nr:hypothetical protein [Ignavibacteriales bacterium]